MDLGGEDKVSLRSDEEVSSKIKQKVSSEALDLEIRNLVLTHTTKDGIFPNLLEFFELVKMIDYEGSQGKVGILKSKYSGGKVIFKIPLFPGFGLRHEHFIMERLKPARKCFPHFCMSFGLLRTYISLDEKNPFLRSGAMILSDVLLSEYIEGSETLTNRSVYYPRKYSYGAARQILLALEYGKRKYGLTHYDPHCDNILIKRCEKDALFLYNFGDKKYLLPTYGDIYMLIDYGYSFMKGNYGQPLYTNMSHTDAGYLSCLSDPFYDARVFLINLSAAVGFSTIPRDKNFRQRILSIFDFLNYHPTKGWDMRQGQYSADEMIVYTIKDLEKETPTSKYLLNDPYLFTTTVQSLIVLPLQNKKNGDFRPYYLAFAKEFTHFEKSVKTDLSRQIIILQLVDSARTVRAQYASDPIEAVRAFRRDFSHYVSKSLEFYIPPDQVNYPDLLKNLYDMVDCIETVYFRVMKDILAKKKEEYKGGVQNSDLYDMIDTYYSTEYNITPTTPVYLWDVEYETKKKIYIKSQIMCDQINQANNRERAQMIWDYLTENKGA